MIKKVADAVKGGKKLIIVNKRYTDKPDTVQGEVAIGFEGKV